MVALKAWLLAFLMFNLDPAWQQTRSGCEMVPVTVGPPGQYVQECTAAWTKGDAELYVFLWTPVAPRDGGPMVAIETFDGTLLGNPVTITRTSQFFGSAQEVLTTATKIASPDSQLMIYARKLPLEDFKAVLAGVAFNPDAVR